MNGKKIIAYVCAVSIIGTTLPGEYQTGRHGGSVVCVNAETLTEGIFEYILNENDEAVIVGCNDADEYDLIIPATLGGKKVTGIGTGESIFGLIDSVVIPEGVTSIGDNAFSYCQNLKSVKLPDSLTSIGDNAFYFCTELESVKLSGNITSIGNLAFADCIELKEVTFDESASKLTSIGCLAFGGTPWFSESLRESPFLIVNNILIGCSSGDNVTISVPETVTGISDEVFSRDLVSISIPESVTSIGKETFSDGSNDLVIFGYEGSYAWQYAAENGINFITVEDCGDDNVSVRWFMQNKEGDFAITIPSEIFGKKVTKIERDGFRGNESITKVILPDGVCSIGNSTFYKCTNLSDINIPESVSEIGEHAFSGTKWFDEKKSEGTDVIINNMLICGVPDAEKTVIPDGVTSIMAGAFSECKNLSDIVIPESVSFIGEGAFKGTPWLDSMLKENQYVEINGMLVTAVLNEDFIIPDGIIKICDGAFKGGILKSVTIPSDVKEIGKNAFFNNEFLENINFSDGLNLIGEAAFMACSCSEIEIPESVTDIGKLAFAECSNLKKAVIPKNVTSIGGNAFSGCDENLVINGYENSYAKKYAADNNIKFITLEEGTVTPPVTTVSEVPVSTVTTTAASQQLTEPAASDTAPVSSSVTEPSTNTQPPETTAKPVTTTKITTTAPKPQVVYFKACASSHTSITEALKSVGADWSFDNRQKIASANGIKNYSGTSEQNITMLNLLKKGKLIDPNGVAVTTKATSKATTTTVTTTTKAVTEATSVSSVSDVPAESSVSVSNSSTETIPPVTVETSVSSETVPVTSETSPESETTMIQTTAGPADTEAPVTTTAPSVSETTMIQTTAGPANTEAPVTTTAPSVSETTMIQTTAGPANTEAPVTTTAPSVSETTMIQTTAGPVNTEAPVATTAASVSSATQQTTAAITLPVTESSVTTYMTYYVTKVTNPPATTTVPEATTTLPLTTTLPVTTTVTTTAAVTSAPIQTTITAPVPTAVSGDCGENLKWSFKDGILSISGTGKMTDYSDKKPAPWNHLNEIITSVSLPEGLTNTGSFAFSGCSLLKSITLPADIISIGEYAFDGCTSVTEIKLPEGLTYIGRYAFRNCSSIAGIKIPDGVTTIEECTFEGCLKLADVVLPEAVSEIGRSAFINCPLMKSVRIPESVTAVGNYSFGYTQDAQGKFQVTPDFTVYGYKETKAYEYSVGYRVKFIPLRDACGENAVYEISPDWTMTVTGEGAINSYSSSKPAPEAFYTLVKKVVIKDGITGIGDYAFGLSSGQNTALEAVEMSDSVEKIGSCAFINCQNLKSVTFGSGLLNVGNSAFQNCSVLASLSFPASVDVIESNAFLNCKSLKDITVSCRTKVKADAEGILKTLHNYTPNEVSDRTRAEKATCKSPAVYYHSCADCGEINKEKTFTYGEPVAHKWVNDEKTWKHVCSECDAEAQAHKYNEEGICEICGAEKKKTNIIVSVLEKIRYAGEKLLSGDIFINKEKSDAVTGVFVFDMEKELVEGDNFIDWSFTPDDENYASVTGAEIVAAVPKVTEPAVTEPPAKVTSGTLAEGISFAIDEKGILTVSGKGNIPDVDSEDHPLANAEKFTGVVIGEGITSVGDNFFMNMKEITNVKLSDSIKRIGNSAFQGCASLESIIIPDGTETIDSSAFRNCTLLKTVSVPASVKTVGDMAFYGCDNLKTLSFLGAETALGAQAVGYTGETPKPVSGVKIKGKPDTAVSEYASGNGIAFETITGNLGSSITYHVDENAVMTISGAGEIPDYDENSSPFTDRRDISKVVFEEGITGIGDFLFNQNRSVQEIVLPSTLKSVGESAFAQCNRLTSVELPKNAEVIGRGAFQGCMALEKVTMNEGLKTIEGYAFEGCARLASVSIPSTVISVEEMVFSNCSSLKDISVSETLPEIKNLPESAKITVRSSETEKTDMSGDADGNGIINIFDYLCIAESIVSGTEPAGRENADMDKDSIIGVSDIIMLRKILMK